MFIAMGISQPFWSRLARGAQGLVLDLGFFLSSPPVPATQGTHSPLLWKQQEVTPSPSLLLRLGEGKRGDVGSSGWTCPFPASSLAGATGQQPKGPGENRLPARPVHGAAGPHWVCGGDG